MFQIIISPLFLLLSLGTSTGMLVHETKVDKIASLATIHPVLAAKKLSGGKLLETMPHTHSDTGTLEASSREIRTPNHGLVPQRDRDEKYRMQKRAARGYHLFDSYYLPLEALTT